jgi:hypothetical protein
MWHYQAILQDDGTVAMHEYYPEMDSWTLNPVELSADNQDDLEWMLRSMLEDLEEHGVMEV